ncbi:asparagine synthase (glutamine-hydrolyzing) [Sulfurimonas autotrophica]|uniref:asparagine synthase (glutamine-hydrolyzing) n=1 Tax=Sulfurimonas autotrophica (strain ATCC BAA-671 / DSM 16294 / JCM 11897 / OK10) TaxID=563040 RepID=E0UT63_SULAO|nr:asparagine synthase (glutamine-hydrolyzing) [Sulfurimonas autotrophica]ADN08166.1 asparagine synthase (glutamine-hydrolyzing) [Sulfurimonas autotrophica DSM 16294]
MCAIFGIIGEYNDNQAKSALSLLSHRGPDYCGITQKKNLFFAHQRLSILDTHHRSHQPLKHKNILLSFNGEIYNFQELKSELYFDFQTQSDSEVIIAAYLKWGIDFVKHLRGMFAIALMDGDTLYLFRDRLGKKPLFYLEGSSFVFASEIKALKPFLSTCKLDNDALLSYLSFLAPTPPHTFYEGIKKLAAGEYLAYKEGQVTCKRYFDLLDAPSVLITTKEEALKKIETLLEESIELRLSADVPVASLLSGGIDSATINYFAKLKAMPLQTYTLGYKEFAKYDERENARQSAEFLGLSNTQIEIDENDFIRASDKVMDTLDEPLNDPAAVPLYLLFEQIKKDGYKVVMSGEGADELFLGYRQYFEYLDIQGAATLAHKNWLKKYFRANFSMNREWEWYKRIFDDTLLFRSSGEKFTDLQKNQLMRRNVKDNESLKYLKSYRQRFEGSQHKDESIWYSYIDLNIFQAEHFLTKLDRVSMAHSIESRTPFLDHKLASALFSIDPKLRYGDGITKSLLKEVMRNKLDTKILTRKKKGFSNPYMEYLINSKKINLIQEVNTQTGMFHKKKLDEYINTASRGSFKQHVWGLYVLSYWIKKNLL